MKVLGQPSLKCWKLLSREVKSSAECVISHFERIKAGFCRPINGAVAKFSRTVIYLHVYALHGNNINCPC